MDADRLGLDFVYASTQIAEAPFGVPWAGWVPDWQCKHLPEMFDANEIARRDLTYRTLLTSAPVVVVSSRMALDDTRRIVPEGTAPLRELPFPAVIEDEFYDITPEEIQDARRRHKLPVRYFLVCNQFWRHKNHRLVIEALARVTKEQIACAFTGERRDPRWPGHFSEMEGLIRERQVGAQTHILGRIDRREQMLLLLGAVAAIQPSRFEGWNTMVEECRALGVPVILSDFPVHREQSPPGARFVGMDDPDALAAAMRDLWFHLEPRPPLSVQRQRHRAYVQDRARAFLSIAQEARSAYDKNRHDPPLIMARLLGRLHRPDPSHGVGETLRQNTTAIVRSALKNRPEALDAFMGVICREFPDFEAEARRLIEVPVLTMMDESARGAYRRISQSPAPSEAALFVGRMKRAAKGITRSLAEKLLPNKD
jgi:glycosyltransferase involved in cell wall biosynthesis